MPQPLLPADSSPLAPSSPPSLDCAGGLPLSPEHQRALRAIFDAGLQAVAPDAALKRHLLYDGRRLGLYTSPLGNEDAGEVDLQGRRLLVVGAGKGAAPMAQAVEDLLGERIYAGKVIVKYDHGVPLERIRLAEAAHPVPDAAGENAAHQVLKLAAAATAEDVVLCLLTGGASALTPALCPGINLEDMRRTTALLLECGATIHEVNAVRKHLSVFSGGQLARAASPARVFSLIVSDVVGDNLDVIASGPTVPDSSTFAQCEDIARRYGLLEQLPASVLQRLQDGLRGGVPETPKQGDAIFATVRNRLVATLDQALQAAAKEAQRQGFMPRVLTSALTGEARVRATELTALALREAASMRPGSRPLCLLAGGETTVCLRGKGRGGRNQEMALASSLVLCGHDRVYGLFAGTDGSDGPTDAAGGFACGTAVDWAAQRGLDAQAYLDENDSYAWLEGSGLLLKTGPTRTNVMDMAVLLVMPPRG